MNYYIDFVPSVDFINEIENIKNNIINSDDSIVLNMYFYKLPSMNVHENVYCNIKDGINYIREINKRKIKINIMLNTFCFGNKEFTERGKEVFDSLDEIFKEEVDFITITNNFFFNYVKRRYSNIKIILSEYSEITNIQKIDRYLENVRADFVKLDYKLSLNIKQMQYIKENFDIERIHIDYNSLYYDNDIYRDAINNSLAHYIQEQKWNEIKNTIEKYQNNYNSIQNKIINMNNDYLKELISMGYKNIWYNLTLNTKSEDYLNNFINIVKNGK